MTRRLALLLVPFLFACGGDTDTDTGTSATVLPDSYQDMTFEQRQRYMMETVLPTMKAEFEALSPAYATMDCSTCHGDGASDGTFSMPNGGLAELDPMDWPTDPPVDFMTNTVVPKMAELLDEQPFDPVSGEGFGCYGCHPAP